MKVKLKPVLIVALRLIEFIMRTAVIASDATMGAMASHGARLRRVRNSVNKHYPAGENPGIVRFTTKPGGSGGTYKLDYLSTVKFYRQAQVIAWYGLPGLARMDEPEIKAVLDAAQAAYLKKDHCDTKGVDPGDKRGPKDQTKWRIRHVGLVYESEDGEDNHLLDLGQDQSKGKKTWHKIRTIPIVGGKLPSIWAWNPILQRDCFPWKHFITDGGKPFETGNPGKDHVVALVASTGPAWVPDEVFG